MGIDRASASCGARASRQVPRRQGLRRVARSPRLITSVPINLLNLQADLHEANSTAAQKALELDLRRSVCEAMAAPLSPPRLLPSGDSAITVEFSRKIDDEANRPVLALDRPLAREPIAGVSETIPTYRSLLVHYDPAQIDFATLGKKLVEL